ncbi:unnamed protein product [Brachionus calyciflorus]|uniref:G-protein coupled receptors family 1 profile domain-containing protein n=1 Tax=Brachionus calyciflorus TaxID=104777 RepID=A0A814GB31_9BILA|nr:unnamed protein product [Brachionus calyciflorus]
MLNNSKSDSLPINLTINEPEDNIILSILSIVDLIIIVLGTIGNLTCFYLLTRKRLRSVSSMRYLSALTLIDCLSLYGWYLSSVYRQLNDESNLKRLENVSSFSCKFIAYLSFTSLQFSSFLLCLISFDRLFIIISSYWRTKYTNKKLSNLIIIFSALFFLILNLVIPLNLGNKGFSKLKAKKYTRDVYSSDNVDNLINLNRPFYKRIENDDMTFWLCYDDNDNLLRVWNILHLCLYSLIPFPILCVLNLIVIYLTRVAAKQANQDQKVKHGQQFVTRLLLFLAISFICTTLPSTITYAFWHKSILTKKYGRLFLNLLNTIQFSRHSFNWIIYLCSSSFMRIEFKKCVSCADSEYEIAEAALAHRPSVAIEIMRQIERNDENFSDMDYDHVDLYYLYCLYEEEEKMKFLKNNKTNQDTHFSNNKRNAPEMNCIEPIVSIYN